MLANNSRPVANPLVKFREIFGDGAILFDPDSYNGFILQPAVGVFIWKCLNGRNTVEDILTELRGSCDNVPEGAELPVRNFIQDLVENGLAGFQFQEAGIRPDKKSGKVKKGERIEWEIPVLRKVLTKAGNGALMNIAAFIPGGGSFVVRGQSGGGCGCGCSGII